MGITLEVRTQGGWHRFVAKFASEDQAIAYAEARRSTHIVGEIETTPLDQEAHSKLIDYLYPTCCHGMSAALCMDPYGPNHFGTYEQDRAHEGW